MEEGFPTFFSSGILHAGLLASYATTWLGPENVRRFETRFTDMTWPGDALTYSGKAAALREDKGNQIVDVDLDCTRNGQSVTWAKATFVL